MPKRKNGSAKKLPELLQTCEELFDTHDLYEVIGVRREATEKEVKKGYYKKSLVVHPDRVSAEEKDEATEQFQTLGKVYAILSDKERRAVYDETGEVGDEDDVLDEDKDWCEYWRLLYPKVTLKDIQEFEKKYKGSGEETEDLKAAYVEAEGDMGVVMESVMCCTADDEERFATILKGLIESEEIPDFPQFSKESKKKKNSRHRKAAAEAQEAEEARKKMKMNDGEGEGSLAALIRKRNDSRAAQADDFFAQLEAKYAKPQKSKKKSKK